MSKLWHSSSGSLWRQSVSRIRCSQVGLPPAASQPHPLALGACTSPFRHSVLRCFTPPRQHTDSGPRAQKPVETPTLLPFLDATDAVETTAAADGERLASHHTKLPHPQNAAEHDASGSDNRFSSIPAISEKTLRAINQDFKFESMSDVQKKVLSLLPTTSDLLVRAKTGTGKTLAFLIAAIETADMRGTKDRVPIVIISPTRELAFQIAREAAKLVKYHRYNVVSLVGGESASRQKQALARGADIVVGTPGRLLDHLENDSAFRERCQGIQVLILDEADVLLEMGFRTDMESIFSHLPHKRQTYMFSATISQGVKGVANVYLRYRYKLVDCVPANEQASHKVISQSYIIAPFSQQALLLMDIINQHRAENPAGKIIVFFSTTKVVKYLSSVFNAIPGMDVMEIHSGLDQRQRTRVNERFRRAYSAVLFTSDVSARGVDYPGVTLVVQMGVPSSPQNYIHRIGRTGRAGKSGQAIMILSPPERSYLLDLHRLPIKQEMRFQPAISAANTKNKEALRVALESSSRFEAAQCYTAFLGFYKQQQPRLRCSSESIVAAANDFATGLLGLPEPPAVKYSLLHRLQFHNIRGVRAIRDDQSTPEDTFHTPKPRKYDDFQGRSHSPESKKGGFGHARGHQGKPKRSPRH
ncbi:P-loop containing nucleoside triphosphate hydrolase protein [Polychytrium aggregatum]|uniref:P-loop containing nucleoside triphosphate hydrolase protein n=1 Tax=Polychytrium aggregatum TaxID=110093 RepID=UPI0022FDBCDA|nr:P-loop containing nucleoside triphosphate hydrolase protein [Polychytrium aggregatum]KAI9203098.1 P-loop containing nucleoside triphosphate hydrolase protein [Polychytrium aggregatum]